MCARARSGYLEDCVCVSQRDEEGERSKNCLSLGLMEEKEISELQRLGVRGYGPQGLVISKLPFS